MNGVSRRFALLLAASLALNLLLVGGLAGRYWQRREFDSRGGGLSPHTFLRRSGLKESDPGMQAIVQTQRKLVRQRAHELAEARAQVQGILKTDPLDTAKLDAALEVVRARTSDMQREMHAGVSAMARATDSEHRRKMADALWPRPGAARGHGHW